MARRDRPRSAPICPGNELTRPSSLLGVSTPESRTELPVLACTLDAGGQADRVARWRELARAGLRDVESGPGRLTLRYQLTAAQLAELRELADGETRCCAFARFAVSATGPDAVLEVAGPAGTELFFDFMSDRG